MLHYCLSWEQLLRYWRCRRSSITFLNGRHNAGSSGFASRRARQHVATALRPGSGFERTNVNVGSPNTIVGGTIGEPGKWRYVVAGVGVVDENVTAGFYLRGRGGDEDKKDRKST